MFITKTMNESAGLDVPNMSLDQYMHMKILSTLMKHWLISILKNKN